MAAGHARNSCRLSPPPPTPQPAGALVDIIGKPADPKLDVVGQLDQRTMLVRGQNNIDVWGHNADRMATVVCRGDSLHDRASCSPKRRSFATARSI